MAFPPVVHEVVESVRFGRVLFAEIVPPPAKGERCRYCRGLVSAERAVPRRAHFSDPAACVRAILSPLDRGAAVDAVVLGGAGEPMRHRGIGAILRRLRGQAHLGAIVLTTGAELRDRDVRREAAEAGLVVVWMPALEDRSEPGDAYDRERAFEHHVEAVASLRRDTTVAIALELPIRPGLNDGARSRVAWRHAAERIRPDRLFIVPAPGAVERELPQALEDMRAAFPRAAGAFLDDGTIVDRRCFCGVSDEDNVDEAIEADTGDDGTAAGEP
jgi:wyosine [tRNA(Phe)-imidazoG37] synthetase (radical SAM superfamily)